MNRIVEQREALKSFFEAESHSQSDQDIVKNAKGLAERFHSFSKALRYFMS